ncbi:MAG TPA: hypothetical protein VFE00_10235 [Arthrobacter sp.]|nr:hypothetical protein [Arthrobacter sp.]
MGSLSVGAPAGSGTVKWIAGACVGELGGLVNGVAHMCSGLWIPQLVMLKVFRSGAL